MPKVDAGQGVSSFQALARALAVADVGWGLSAAVQRDPSLEYAEEQRLTARTRRSPGNALYHSAVQQIVQRDQRHALVMFM